MPPTQFEQTHKCHAPPPGTLLRTKRSATKFHIFWRAEQFPIFFQAPVVKKNLVQKLPQNGQSEPGKTWTRARNTKNILAPNKYLVPTIAFLPPTIDIWCRQSDVWRQMSVFGVSNRILGARYQCLVPTIGFPGTKYRNSVPTIGLSAPNIIRCCGHV